MGTVKKTLLYFPLSVWVLNMCVQLTSCVLYVESALALEKCWHENTQKLYCLHKLNVFIRWVVAKEKEKNSAQLTAP